MTVVKDHNYPIEKHYVNTEDGYILCMFRISGPKGSSAVQNANQRKLNPNQRPKPVLFYQHGLMDSAAGICVDGLDSMAFYFADLGFDVWMGNSRGNRYSKNHRYLESSQEEFWNFSFYELGRFDLPAQISYILTETRAPNLTYMGHSQGTTQMFSALAEEAEWYRERVNLFVMLAPVVRVDRCNNPNLKSMIEN